MKYYDSWRSRLLTGSHGSAEIRKATATDLDAVRAAFHGRHIKAGDTCTQLLINGYLMMSDTRDEYSDHWELFNNAKGHVLVNGLGLGCALQVLQTIEAVSAITVVEINPDVVELVGKHFPDVEIITDDAYTWKPPVGARYGAVWHDIWPDICEDNLPGMHKLHRRYGRRCDWQASWSRWRLGR